LGGPGSSRWKHHKKRQTKEDAVIIDAALIGDIDRFVVIGWDNEGNTLVLSREEAEKKARKRDSWKTVTLGACHHNRRSKEKTNDSG
jgi:hypothetical protein